MRIELLEATLAYWYVFKRKFFLAEITLRLKKKKKSVPERIRVSFFPSIYFKENHLKNKNKNHTHKKKKSTKKKTQYNRSSSPHLEQVE